MPDKVVMAELYRETRQDVLLVLRDFGWRDEVKGHSSKYVFYHAAPPN